MSADFLGLKCRFSILILWSYFCHLWWLKKDVCNLRIWPWKKYIWKPSPASQNVSWNEEVKIQQFANEKMVQHLHSVMELQDSFRFFYLFFFFNLFTFYWRIIALQNFAVFCQTSTWISHRYTYNPPPLFLTFLLLIYTFKFFSNECM